MEAVFKEGSWALATVRSTRAKQVEVEYVREQEEEPQETGPSGTRYLAKENETARGIAARFGLAVGALMHLNAHVDGLTPSAKLKHGKEAPNPTSHQTPLFLKYVSIRAQCVVLPLCRRP